MKNSSLPKGSYYHNQHLLIFKRSAQSIEIPFVFRTYDFVAGISGLTKRAADGGDSAAFSGIFCDQTESCSRSFIPARPHAGNASR